MNSVARDVPEVRNPNINILVPRHFPWFPAPCTWVSPSIVWPQGYLSTYGTSGHCLGRSAGSIAVMFIEVHYVGTQFVTAMYSEGQSGNLRALSNRKGREKSWW
jgi:hypothetical protein